MENTSIQEASGTNSQRELANDVALLYSWAKVENTPYRDFSRQRTSPSGLRREAGGKAEAGDERVSNDGNIGVTASSPVADIRSVAAPEAKSTAVGQQHPTHVVSSPASSTAAAGAMRTGYREAVAPRQASPVLAVFSIAGGVGKTSICAGLGKTLNSLGEQILLVDATGRGLLPFHFGATELRTGPRRFLSPDNSAPPIQVIAGDVVTQEWLDGDVKPLMATAQRTLIDLGQLSESLLSSIVELCTVVLIPLLPDLNSITSVALIEKLMNKVGAARPAVFYFFNRFNEHSMNDQQAREFVEQHCGQRLLPISLRNGRELAEALHAGVTGTDHTAGSELSHDYLELALWLRRIAPVSTAAVVAGRWSEQ